MTWVSSSLSVKWAVDTAGCHLAALLSGRVMAWRINKHDGVYKKGAPFPLQKRYQIAASYLQTGSYGAAAAENMCTYDAARSIVNKFLTTGLFDPGNRGSPPTIMQPWKVAYLEALVTHDPFMYLSEIQAAIRDDLNLPPAEIPSIPTICRTLLNLDLTRHKASKVSLERFTPENIARRTAFVNWRRTVDPRKLYFVDETAIQLANGVRTVGRCHTNSKRFLSSPTAETSERKCLSWVWSDTMAEFLEHILYTEALTDCSLITVWHNILFL